MEPCFIDDLPMSDYQADTQCPTPSLSSGLIKTLLTNTPRHAWMAHPRLNPNYKPRVSESFDMGTAVHGLLLEGDAKVCVIDAADWRTNKAKEERDEARANGLTPLLAGQYEGAKKMVEAAQDFIDTSPLALAWHEAKSEVSMFWQEGDVWMRGRMDRYSAAHNVVFDPKTSESTNPGAFMRSIPQFGYDTQAEVYCRGVQAITGKGAPRFYNLVIEVTAPHLCYFVEMSAARFGVAQSRVNRAVKTWGACLKSGKWPAYQELYLSEPEPWELAREEEML